MPWTKRALLRYPTLSLEQVHATLAYYWRHQARIDAYLQTAREHEERMIREQERYPSPAVQYLYCLLRERGSQEYTP